MFLHLLHVFFIVIFALAILIFIVIILTLARSNNFVVFSFTCRGPVWLGFVILLFFLSSFFILIFYLPFF